MKPLRFMFVAGEPSGDALAAGLVTALREECTTQGKAGGDSPEFFGAGGPKMAAAGVDLALDLTAHSVIGVIEALQGYLKFRRILNQLVELACERRPDVIVCVDFSGFNRRFTRQIRDDLGTFPDLYEGWRPRIVQYVSPQVWASRPGRAHGMDRDYDLLLSIIPFEQAWYAKRAPGLRVEFVGHPLVEKSSAPKPDRSPTGTAHPLVLLLPGSRRGELERHLPVLVPAARRVAAQRPVLLRMILPDQKLAQLAREISGDGLGDIEVQIGSLDESLRTATLALASTGTVTMECAWHGLPTVAFYRTSWSTYQIGRRIITVRFLAMPNILADEALYPELIQNDFTPDHLAREAIGLLDDLSRRSRIRSRLSTVMKSLGQPGAARRAAGHVLSLLN